jgi:hypothetical protein
MPGYHLADAVHLARYDAATIVLDLEADRYFLIKGKLHTALHDALEAGQISGPNEGPMATLLEQNLIRPADCHPPKRDVQPTLIDRTALLAIPAASMDWRGLFIILGMVKTMIEVRHRPILDIFRDLEARKSQALSKHHDTRQNPAYASSVSAALRGADLILGANHGCLPRSICAMRVLLRHGLKPCLVMGVTERPFEAHCWVELGPFVVTDIPDRIMPYKPIFVL